MCRCMSAAIVLASSFPAGRVIVEARCQSCFMSVLTYGTYGVNNVGLEAGSKFYQTDRQR